MLLYPAIDELKTKVDSKYTLAVLTARRTRDIVDGKPMLTIDETGKPLSVATAEVYENLISYKRLSDEELLARAEEKAKKKASGFEGGFAREAFRGEAARKTGSFGANENIEEESFAESEE